LSGTLIVCTVLLLWWNGGPNYGVDFTGGVIVQVRLDKKHTPSEIREALKAVQLENSIIQEFGDRNHLEFLIRIIKTDVALTGLGEKVKQALVAEFGKGVEIRRIEMDGPRVGKDLRQKALFAIFYSLLFIAIYISGRFELKWMMSIVMAGSLAFVVYVATIIGMSVTWLIILAMIAILVMCWVMKLKYALGAIVALIHDVFITVGMFAFTDKEISLSVVAALLTIVGYSLNDTIIVFDRIRENIKKLRRKPFDEIMNKSINETLSRTILTSSTTLIVVISLFILGGNVIHNFAFAMLVGIVVGTYSSIFVASPVLLLWHDDRSGNHVKTQARSHK
jgi:preprotein translocase subunit SecF